MKWEEIECYKNKQIMYQEAYLIMSKILIERINGRLT